MNLNEAHINTRKVKIRKNIRTNQVNNRTTKKTMMTKNQMIPSLTISINRNLKSVVMKKKLVVKKKSFSFQAIRQKNANSE